MTTATEQFELLASAPEHAEQTESDQTDAVQPASLPLVDLPTVTLLAVFDGERWVSLCRELDISSDGETSAAALLNLVEAINEAAEVAAESRVDLGAPVPDPELFDFMDSHKGAEPMAVRILSRQLVL